MYEPMFASPRVRRGPKPGNLWTRTRPKRVFSSPAMLGAYLRAVTGLSKPRKDRPHGSHQRRNRA